MGAHTLSHGASFAGAAQPAVRVVMTAATEFELQSLMSLGSGFVSPSSSGYISEEESQTAFIEPVKRAKKFVRPSELEAKVCAFQQMEEKKLKKKLKCIFY